MFTNLEAQKSYETDKVEIFQIGLKLTKLLRLEHFREFIGKSEPLGL